MKTLAVQYDHILKVIKFVFSKKTTKICTNLPIFHRRYPTVLTVAFLENMNFIYSHTLKVKVSSLIHR